MPTFTVATWNIGPGKAFDLAAIMAEAKVCGLQEASDQGPMLEAYAAAHPGVDLYRPHAKTGQAATPILVDGPVVASSSHKAVGRSWVGNGAGPAWSKPKWINHVELPGKIHHLNTHMVASVTRSAKDIGRLSRLARRRHFRKHIAAIVALVKTLDGDVILTMDGNATADFDLFKPLHDLGFVGWSTQATHGDRAIDQVLYLERRRLTPNTVSVLPTGSDHDAVIAVLNVAQEVPVPTKKVPAPAPPYLGPPKFHGGSDNRPIKRIVIHGTAGAEPGVVGAARSTAAYTKATTRPSSWHYCADALESVQLTYDSVVAFHDGTNVNSIGYELCCSLSNSGGILVKATAHAKALTHWQTPSHRAMLRIAAKDCAQLALANDIPIRRIRATGIKNDLRGFCGHVDMRNAYPSHTTHWDPGPFFPWRRFLRLVRKYATDLQESK